MTKAISAKYPKGKVKEAEKVTAGATVAYEVDVVSGTEKAELILDDQGTIISTKTNAGDKEEGEGDESEKDDDNGKENKE